MFYAATFVVGYGYLSLFIVGFVCNLFTMLFAISALKLSNINVYLLFLAILDSCALVGNLLPSSIKFWYHFLTTKYCFTNTLNCINPSYMSPTSTKPRK